MAHPAAMRSAFLVPVVLVLALACSPPPPPAAPGPVDPLQVLHDWDAARALAWARGDPVALAGLYQPGAATGRRDVALLRRYLARGVRLHGMRMQVLSARTVVRSQARLRLVVVERFAGAYAADAAGVRVVPAGVPVTRVIDLRRPADRWLVVAVRPWPRAGSR